MSLRATNPEITVKGRLMRLIASVAATGPWRAAAERLTCRIGHKFPTNRMVLSFCRHFAAVLIETEGPRFQRVVTFDSGGKMQCGGDEKLNEICAMYYFVGTITNQDEDERPLATLLSRAIRRGDTFFDIGSNVGFYSFFLGPLCGPSGSVHAFEANPLLIRHLLRSADLNKPMANIKVNAVAVGSETNKMLQLYDPERIGCSSLHKLDWLNAESSVTVPLTTIDHYIKTNRINRVDVVKIDIEGSELDAFRGMVDTFEACPPWLIVCELAFLISTDENRATVTDPKSAPASQPLEIISLLRAKGYEPRYIRDSDGRLGEPVDPARMDRLSRNLINVAFVHPSARTIRPELFGPELAGVA
jgi:FkbM family methyltransferase